MRIAKMLQYYKERKIDVKLFDQWTDKISECDILHVFKANIDNYNLISYAKEQEKKVVISSVIPQEKQKIIRIALLLHRIFKVNNTYSFIQKELFLADKIVAQTRKEATFIHNVYKIAESKIVIIPNGVDESLIAITQDKVKDIVLNVGRFDKNKNQINMIRALKNTDIPVYFVGGGVSEQDPYYQMCLNEAESSPNIHFTGWLKNGSDELIALYARAKVVTLLSHKEIFGNSLIEGGASGSNLVATNILPTQEWGINNYCVQVSPNNISDIKHGIEEAYERPIDPTLREIIIQQFSWKTVVDAYLLVYKEILE